MDIEQIQLEKARIWAYWGFIGVMFPIAGIISSSVSISILNRLVIDEDDQEALDEQVRIINRAEVARIVSSVILIATIVGAIFITTQLIHAHDNDPAREYYQRILDNADKS